MRISDWSSDVCSSDLPVLLQIDAGRAIGDAAGSIRFQEPWACGFDLQVAGVQGEVATYSFTRAGAGRCTPYTQGYARVQPNGLGIDVQLLKKDNRSEEHTSELQSLMRISYAVFCLNKKTHQPQ